MNTSAPSPAPRAPGPLLVWWVLWFAITNGLIMLRVFLKPAAPAGDSTSLIAYVALVPLFLSAAIRIFVLPRQTSLVRALPLFIAGLATAEACGIIGLFLGGPRRDTFVALSLLLLAAYAPVFARKYSR